MPDPTWPSSPPEANYARLVGSGAGGTGTTLASAAAWQALMAGNELAASMSTLNTAVTALNFEGLGGAASASTATGLNTSLHLLAGWVQEKPPIAASAVAAYETAASTMIPAAVSLANRAEQAADVAMNPLVLGALTPAIVALDLEYFGEHWPHNASAGAAYGSVLTALLPALAVPPPLAPPGASPSGVASAATALAETAGRTAAGEAMRESGQVATMSSDVTPAPAEAVGGIGALASSAIQPLQSAAQPLMGMFQAPMQAFQSLSDLPQSIQDPVGGLSGLEDEAALPAAMLGAGGAGLSLAGSGGAGSVGGSMGSAGAGAGGVGAGALPGAGLTSYNRPTSSFEPENGGRPASIKAGLLSASDLRGPTTTAGSGAVPVSPAQAGMLGGSKGDSVKAEVQRSRIVLAIARPPGGPR